MSQEKDRDESSIKDEALLRWNFLEDESEACAVVSDRMELVYLNDPARDLVPVSWFGKRCFEVFPTADKLCALHCPTLNAVHEGTEIEHCHESLVLENGVSRELEVAVIPLGGETTGRAAAMLLLRNREILVDADEEERQLFAEARRLQQKVGKRFAT